MGDGAAFAIFINDDGAGDVMMQGEGDLPLIGSTGPGMMDVMSSSKPY